MRRIITLLLTLALALSLAGCSLFKPDILGTYQMEIDLSQSVVDIFDEGTLLADSGFSIKYYLPEFKIVVLFEFYEDRTYRMTTQKESVHAAVQTLKSAAANMIDDYLFLALKQQYADYGFTVETRQEAVGYLGMSWDDLYEDVLGQSLDSYVDALVSDSFVTALTADYCSEGQFKARKGQLHLSEDLTLEPSKEIYETYEKTDSFITFTGSVNLPENERIAYPYVITAVN